ncbi:MAG: Ig-like domain-containing protein [Bacteroidaceae bacterium]|nr:Ig-like domain-containing protein [Bacteroidaceae bacterium]
MTLNRIFHRLWLLGPCLFVAMLWEGCANPGQPDGGAYDETPPRVVGSVPAFGKTKSKARQIDIYFDELVALDNATDKVVVSPPQINMPDIATKGRYIRVKLNDTLKENTTYTIDFSDAIVDNNEGNPLGNYAFVFSTGDSIDSMEVAGTVVNAEDLEPIKGLLVGLHSDTTDTAVISKPFDRVARTNGSGQFVIRGVANGTYRIYALEDADGDFRYSQKSERMAFLPHTITTGSYPDIRYDTVWHDSTHIDSIRAVPYTHYTPDNVVLRAFSQSKADRHLLKAERTVPEHFELYFTAPSDSLPRIEGLNFKADDAFVVDYNAGRDTLCYWIRDTTLAWQDTLEMVVRYMEHDTAGILRETADTMLMTPKVTHEKQLKWAKDAYEKWEKEQKKLKKRGAPYQEKYPEKALEIDAKIPSSLAPNDNLSLLFKEPLAAMDTTKIHLYLRRDSTYEEAPFVFRQEGSSVMYYKLYGEWRPTQQYRLLIDSAAFVGIYGHVSDKMDNNISIPDLDTYCSLIMNLKGVQDTMAIVQLLNSSSKVMATVRSVQGRGEFYFVKPGIYYLRLFIDRNGNGVWDEGDYEKGIEPEETYYYPDKLQLKARWDYSQDWDIHALPFNKQKPLEITKQKPDKKKEIQKRNAEREAAKRR